MAPAEVSIVGAGMGGLTAALALQRFGMRVRVYEQAEALGEVGAGLHITPNGYKVLAALGVTRALEPLAFRPRAISTRHYRSGEPNFEGALDAAFEQRFGAPYIDLHRADLHQALARAVRGNDPGCVHLGCELTGVSENSRAARAEFAGGMALEAPVLVAADGVHSVIRSCVHGEPGARFTGHVAYRGIVRAGGFPVELIEPKLNVWVGPGRHFVAYYIRGGELLNYVGIVEDHEWRTESWTSPADHGELREHFSDWHAGVRALIEATVDQQCFRWALLVRDPLSAWSTDHITLLGDAAHPMVPYLGQGANAAIEDGWVLAHCLATAETPAAGLRAYEAARLARTARVQAAAWEQGELNHAVGRRIDGEGFRGGNFADASWIYAYDCVRDYPPP